MKKKDNGMFDMFEGLKVPEEPLSPERSSWRNDEEATRYFLDMWKNQREEYDTERNDKIGYAYLRHVVGVDDYTALDFALGYPGADTEVGLRLGGVKEMKNDCRSFWKAVAEISGGYTTDDIEWISEKGKEAGAFMLISTLGYGALIRKILLTAHAYK